MPVHTHLLTETKYICSWIPYLETYRKLFQFQKLNIITFASGASWKLQLPCHIKPEAVISLYSYQPAQLLAVRILKYQMQHIWLFYTSLLFLVINGNGDDQSVLMRGLVCVFLVFAYGTNCVLVITNHFFEIGTGGNQVWKLSLAIPIKIFVNI